MNISLRTGWNVYEGKYKARGRDVWTDRREDFIKNQGVCISRIDSPTSYYGDHCLNKIFETFSGKAVRENFPVSRKLIMNVN